jgi:ubiquinone biosynthesis monooxygenase Coq7
MKTKTKYTRTMLKSPAATPLGDALIDAVDGGLRTLFSSARPKRDWRMLQPQSIGVAPPLSEDQKRHAAGLMRVNHVGEVCAQALYTAQAITSRDPAVREQLARAAQEETDHLAWTEERLKELGSRTSVLNPLWYAGAFAIGLVAGRAGDKWSLGFVSETERQVEAHLASHLGASDGGLPTHDTVSRAIVEQMKIDEAEHGQLARDNGGAELPEPIKIAMKAAAKVMTTLAYRV